MLRRIANDVPTLGLRSALPTFLLRTVFSAPANAPRRILVVDDEPALRETISLTLEQAGHQTATAANGKEGAQRIAQEGFDLVITDMLMPGCDGLEFIAEIHRRHPQLRILAMTGGGRIPSEH